MPRVVLLARAGKAADNIVDALRQAGVELALAVDPSQTDEATLRAQDPQVILVALEPSIENALEKFESYLVDPALTVIYDEADLAAHRAGWDAARWLRHLSAKLRRDTNVLPPGTESDQDWQPSPGRIPEPATDFADVDLAVFTREAAASAGSVPSDGMPAESVPSLHESMPLDATLLDAIPASHAVQTPPLPSASQTQTPAVFEIDTFEIESFETESFETESFKTAALVAATPQPSASGEIELDEVELDASPVDSAPAELRSLESESMQLESMQDESMQDESMQDESTQLESMQLESMQDESMRVESMQAERMELEDSPPESLRLEEDTESTASVSPMSLDDDAFFLEELSADAAVSKDGDIPPMQFDGGFEADLDSRNDAGSDLDLEPAAVAAPRVFEEVLSFETVMAERMSAAEVASAPPPAEQTPSERQDGFSLDSLSLTPVDESPMAGEAPTPAPRTHDLSALEARISSLSLVDLDAGEAGKPDMPASGDEASGVVLVEAGLGGPDPARQLLSSIPSEFPAVVLVRLHLQGGRYDRLVAQMARAAALPVALAQNGAGANPGTIYFLPDGVGLEARRGRLEFTADGAPAKAIFNALPPGGSAIVFLSGSDPQLVDVAMAARASGALVIAQSAEDCYDGAACAELRKRGVASGLPAELAGRLASRWPN